MPRHSFIQMQKLSNVSGRIDYISSRTRQENLYAVHNTAPSGFWRSLARESQQEFRKSGAEGRCIEARELIIALPETYQRYDPETVLRFFTNAFKDQYHVECASALHHNKRKTNYHIHLIFSERQLLKKPVEKIATRNMFYNEQEKHVRTKKEILDDEGNVRAGCKVIPKGAAYERRAFSNKNSYFKKEIFLEEEKKRYTELINQGIQSPTDKLQVFGKNSIYLPTKKIGKNNPKAREIKADNQAREEWNQTADVALVEGVEVVDILSLKQHEIHDKVKRSIAENGRTPRLLRGIILVAKEILQELIRKFTMPPKPQLKTNLPEFEKMTRIKTELHQQLTAIQQVERRQLPPLKRSLEEIKGVFKGKERKEIEKNIKDTEERLFNMKAYLQKIISGYGYKSVQSFLSAYQQAESEVLKHQTALKVWTEKHGKAPARKQNVLDIQSLHETQTMNLEQKQISQPKSCKKAR